MLYGEALGDPEADGDLPRSAVHRVYVGEVHYGSLIAEVFERHVCQIKVHSFKQHVRTHKNIRVRI